MDRALGGGRSASSHAAAPNFSGVDDGSLGRIFSSYRARIGTVRAPSAQPGPVPAVLGGGVEVDVAESLNGSGDDFTDALSEASWDHSRAAMGAAAGGGGGGGGTFGAAAPSSAAADYARKASAVPGEEDADPFAAFFGARGPTGPTIGAARVGAARGAGPGLGSSFDDLRSESDTSSIASTTVGDRLSRWPGGAPAPAAQVAAASRGGGGAGLGSSSFAPGGGSGSAGGFSNPYIDRHKRAILRARVRHTGASGAGGGAGASSAASLESELFGMGWPLVGVRDGGGGGGGGHGFDAVQTPSTAAGERASRKLPFTTVDTGGRPGTAGDGARRGGFGADDDPNGVSAYDRSGALDGILEALEGGDARRGGGGGGVGGGVGGGGGGVGGGGGGGGDRGDAVDGEDDLARALSRAPASPPHFYKFLSVTAFEDSPKLGTAGGGSDPETIAEALDSVIDDLRGSKVLRLRGGPPGVLSGVRDPDGEKYFARRAEAELGARPHRSRRHELDLHAVADIHPADRVSDLRDCLADLTAEEFEALPAGYAAELLALASGVVGLFRRYRDVVREE